KYSDAKVIGILTINGIIATIALANLGSATGYLHAHPILVVLFCFGILSEAISTLACVRCLAPALNVGESQSVIYYAHICKRFDRPHDYVEEALRVFGSTDRVRH